MTHLRASVGGRSGEEVGDDRTSGGTEPKMSLLLEAPRPTQGTGCGPARSGGYRGPVGAVDDDACAQADAAVAKAWATGDPAALRLAWDQFGSLVFTYCVRALGDRELAADCTQETFLGAWRSRERSRDRWNTNRCSTRRHATGRARSTRSAAPDSSCWTAAS